MASSTLHSYDPPTDVASYPPSQRHHHNHEHHHHHHSHYVRPVKPDGPVKETIEEKHADELKEEKIVVEAQAEATPELVAPPIIASSAKASTKTKSRAASVKARSAAATTSHITRTKSIFATTSSPAQVVEVVPAAPSAPSVAAPPPTVVPSVKAPSKVPSVKAVDKPPSVKAPTIRPLSPTPSHRSRYSHHHPEVIVNVTIPQAVAAPVPIPPPVIAAIPPTPIVIEETVKEAAEEAVEDFSATPLVVPATVPPTTTRASTIASIPAVPPSPSLSTRPRLSGLQSTTTAPLPPVVPTAEEQGVGGESEEEIVEETKVVTTTRTIKRRPGSPPEVFETGSRYVESIPEEEEPAPPPPPPPPPPHSTKPKSVKSSSKPLPPLSPVHSAPNTPVTMKCHFFGSKSSPPPKTRTIGTTTVETVSYPLLPQSVEEADVNTAVTTAGGPTTKGMGCARSVALTVSSGRMSGTKAGIRPIPMVDYQALMKRSPLPSQTKPLSPPTVAAAPAPMPITIAEVTTSPAQAMTVTELRPASTVAMTTPGPRTVPPPNALPPSTAPPPSTLAPTTVAMEATAPTGPKTIMTLSAQLDKDSHGNEHLHARWRDHTNANEADVAIGHDAREHVGIIESRGRTNKERRRPEKRDKFSSPPYRPVGALPPPMSERYAYPAAPSEIGRQARERLSAKLGRGGAPLPLPLPHPQLFPRPPPLVGVRPPSIPHQMFNPMMLNPMMPGYPMGTMGMPMGMGMPMAAPIPGIMPGMPGVGNLPRGWFGRDQLGRGAHMGPGM